MSLATVCVVALLPVVSPAAAERPGHVRLEPCKEAKPNGRCGTVPVPLDRSNPAAGTIDLFFALFPHRASGPAESTIVVTEGGPGLSVTQDQFLRQFYPEIFAPLLKTHDLILLDQRGVGKSGAIDCPDLQHGKGDTYAAVRECGAQLGSAANLYASDNVALDLEAVRAALGIDKLDLYGGSYAAQDVQAYAARFPEHVRSAVLDSPATTVGWDVFDHYSPAQWLHAAQLICKRSPSCAPEPGNAKGDIARLARRLRNHPVRGAARDATGKRHRVKVTEGDLLWRMLGNDGNGSYTAPSEIDAAARALRDGDPAPLLRLAAENDDPFFGDDGKAKQFSSGENFARYCTDNPMPWDKAAPVETRGAQYTTARAALAEDTFAPFSIDGWLAPLPTGPLGPDPCIEWPAPDPDVPTPIPPGAQLPSNVPALVLTGDLDMSTAPETARGLADAWANSRLVEILQAGHHTATPLGGRNACADGIIVKFIADLDPGAARCAAKAPRLFPVVGRFPETVRQARQAARAHGDHSSPLDRKLATVAAATVTDGFRRNFQRGGAGTSPGLRGGTVTIELNDDGDGIVMRLDKSRFASDVAVGGRASYGFESEILGAKVHLRGPRGKRGRLRIKGLWYAYFHDATTLKVRGKIGGHRVNVRVPAS